ncbi:MAG: YebC/PmpR family DNA-binding transcriptional regulator [Chloroflexi bacterium]|nr:YebC/PmpR family DNA-binding transcriptional regulator [Chloroflexota bacterium]
MSGHSKWSTIKHQKGVADAKRGQLFTKLTREIIVAAKQGGPNPEGNARLRLAIQKARDARMPNDNIDRAVKKGSGTLEGATLEEFSLEGYGPSGAAILIQAVTDNRNRTLQEIRNVFSRNGGSLGEPGSVAYLFESKGVVTVKPEGTNPEDVELQAIDAGADDVRTEGKIVEIYTRPGDLEKVRQALEAKNLKVASSELAMIPKTMLPLDEKAALQTLKLLDRLEELDEVQHVFSNADFSDAVMEAYQSAAASSK